MNNIEFNSAGFVELLKSAEVSEYCKEVANQVLSRCGEGYATKQYNTPSRVISIVYADTKEAYQDNLDNNTLLKSLR